MPMDPVQLLLQILTDEPPPSLPKDVVGRLIEDAAALLAQVEQTEGEGVKVDELSS